MNAHPTLAAVAAAAGVSVMTVSKVLRGQGRISQTVRERVRTEAARLGYRPNPYAVGLAQAKQGGATRGTLALLVGHRDANPLTAKPPHPLHYHYSRMVAGVRARAEDLGYGLDVFWVFEPGLSERRLGEILRARGIVGLVLLSVQPSERAIDWDRYACAGLGRPRRAVVPFAFADFFSATRLAFLRTHAAGYRRIGLVIDEVHNQLSEGRCLGACVAAQATCEGAERVKPLVSSGAPLDNVMLERWLKRERPDAILFFRNRVPELLAARVTREAEPLKSVDLDLRTRDETTTGVWLPHGRIGAAGVDLVHMRLNRGERGLEHSPVAVELPGIWWDGLSVTPRSSPGIPSL